MNRNTQTQNVGLRKLSKTSSSKGRARPISLDSKLSGRLKEVYGMTREPTTISDFAAQWRSLLKRRPEARKFMEGVRTGKNRIGETSLDKGYSLDEGGEEGRVMCGLDTLATAWLRGEGSIHAKCPHCEELTNIQVEGGKIVGNSRPDTVFFLGAGPRDAPGNPMCDHLHLFPSSKHANEWVRAQRDEVGVTMTLEEAFKLGRIFDV